MENKIISRTLVGLFVWGVSLTVQAETKVTQEIVTGVQAVSLNNNEAKFEEYREVPNGIVVEKYVVEGESETSAYSLELNKISQNDQSALFGYESGKLSVAAGYDQIPHTFSNYSKTLYQETSPGVLVLPDGMQGTVQGAATTNAWFSVMNSTFVGLAHDQPLATRTDKSSVNLGYALSPSLSLELGFYQTKKSGHQLQAFGLSRSHAVELAKPVDQTVYDSTVGLGYNVKGLTLGFVYGLNIYQNDIQTLMWDNSRRATDVSGGQGAAAGRAALAPDNLAHNAKVSAAVDLPAKTRLNAELTYVRMSQDEAMLPYTSNSKLIFPAELPSATVDAQQTLVAQNYQLSNSLFKSVDMGLKIRSEQLGNDSKEMHFDGHTVLDGSIGAAQDTGRFAYHKFKSGAYADWRIVRSLALGMDVSRETAVRTEREYRETEETEVNSVIRFRPVRGLGLSGKYLWNDRVGNDYQKEHYDPEEDNVFNEIPALRRPDIGPRIRNAGELTADTHFGTFALSLSGGMGLDKFKAGEGLVNDGVSTHTFQTYGVLEQRNSRAGLDMSYDLSNSVGLFGFYQFEEIQGVQRSNYGATAPNQDSPSDWTLQTVDRYDVFGLGVDLQPTQKIGFGFGYDLSYSRGAYDYEDVQPLAVTSAGSASTPIVSPPETKSCKQDYKVQCQYKAKENVTFTVGYLFERFDVSDFAKDIAPLTSGQAANQTNLLMGDYISDYKAHVVSLLAKYKF
jgi:MtrB/PioB family decaheme-associated outer membrane protein